MLYRFKHFYYHLLRKILGDWNFFLYDEKKKEKRILHQYYTSTNDCKNEDKYVIFMANGFSWHAGLCDRLKGIVTLYQWCKKNKTSFKIYFNTPFQLNKYLITNMYNWEIESQDICYNGKEVSVNHCMYNPLVYSFINDGTIFIKSQKWLNHHLNKNYKQIHVYTNIYPQSDYEFGTLFQELFQPSPLLLHHLNKHSILIGGKYCSISFRFVQLLGDFRDCEGETLSIDAQQHLIRESIKAIKDIKAINDNIPHLLVTSDSIKFLSVAAKIPYVYVIEGQIGHIDYDSSDETAMKTFLDFFMIAKAEKVYLAKSEKMYNSDFARRASMIYHRPFELYEY